jgi:hypothetical protein
MASAERIVRGKSYNILSLSKKKFDTQHLA